MRVQKYFRIRDSTIKYRRTNTEIFLLLHSFLLRNSNSAACVLSVAPEEVIENLFTKKSFFNTSFE